MTFEGKERRQYPRFNVSLQIALTPDGNGLIEGRSRDLSMSGIFVFLDETVEPETTVKLEINDTKSERNLNLTGVVVHNLRDLGVGIRFIDVSHDDSRCLADIIDELRSEEENLLLEAV